MGINEWCPEKDSNLQSSASKADAFAILAIGALVGSEGVEPPMSSMLVIYSHAPYRSGNFPLVGLLRFELRVSCS